MLWVEDHARSSFKLMRAASRYTTNQGNKLIEVSRETTPQSVVDGPIKWDVCHFEGRPLMRGRKLRPIEEKPH